jgi:hypothetical protein
MTASSGGASSGRLSGNSGHELQPSWLIPASVHPGNGYPCFPGKGQPGWTSAQPGNRLHRHLPGPLDRPAHSARGDGRGAGRTGRGGKDPPRRRVQLQRRPDARAGRFVRVETLQPAVPHVPPGHRGDRPALTAEHDIGALVYGPMAHGLLSGRMSEFTTFDPDDWRSKSPDFTGQTFHRNLAVVQRLKGFARERDISLPSSRSPGHWPTPAVHVAIVGVHGPPNSTGPLQRRTWSSPRPTLRKSTRFWRTPCPCGARIQKVCGRAATT